MNRNFSFILLLIGALAATRAGAAVVTNAASTNAVAAKPEPVKSDAKLDFSSFRIITERNIFDMSRSGGRGRIRSVPVVKVDDFTLIGTMSYEKGQFAFFDGSGSEYRLSLKVADSIAGFKITAIGSDYVELQSATNQPVRMTMGTQMRRRDKGPWSLGSYSEPVVSNAEHSSDEVRGSGSTLHTQAEQNAAAAAREQRGGSEDEIMKRLMEKRAKALLKKGDQ